MTRTVQIKWHKKRRPLRVAVMPKVTLVSASVIIKQGVAIVQAFAEKQEWTYAMLAECAHKHHHREPSGEVLSWHV